MANTYDKEANKRIWQELVIPKELIEQLQVARAMKTSDAVNYVREQCFGDPEARLKEIIEAVAPEHQAALEARKAAEALQKPVEKKGRGRSKKVKAETNGHGGEGVQGQTTIDDAIAGSEGEGEGEGEPESADEEELVPA